MEEARKRNLMTHIVQRMQKRGAVMALNRWRTRVLDAVQERAEEERRNAVMHRVVRRMLHASLASGFGRWADCVREVRRQRGIMERVAMRMRNAGMFAALQRWRENTTEKKSMGAKSTRCKSIPCRVSLMSSREAYMLVHCSDGGLDFAVEGVNQVVAN